MKAAKIVVGIVFLVAAAVVHGATHSNQGCYTYPSGDAGRNDNAPAKCKTWNGCASGGSNGPQPDRCSGFFNVEIGDATIAYDIGSCKVESTGSVYKCKDYPAVSCNDKAGTVVCLTYKVYYLGNCIDDGNTAIKSQSTDRCSTNFSG